MGDSALFICGTVIFGIFVMGGHIVLRFQFQQAVPTSQRLDRMSARMLDGIPVLSEAQVVATDSAAEF